MELGSAEQRVRAKRFWISLHQVSSDSLFKVIVVWSNDTFLSITIILVVHPVKLNFSDKIQSFLLWTRIFRRQIQKSRDYVMESALRISYSTVFSCGTSVCISLFNLFTLKQNAAIFFLPYLDNYLSTTTNITDVGLGKFYNFIMIKKSLSFLPSERLVHLIEVIYVTDKWNFLED